MGTIVDTTIPTEQFALRDTFESVHDAEFQTVRVVAHETGQLMPYIWASASDLDALHEALQADSSTEDVTRLATGDGRSLYQMTWRAHMRVIVYVLVEEQGTLLGAHGQRDQWEFRILFPDHDSVSATYDFCAEYGINLTIRRVNGVGDLVRHGGAELSEKQHEALVTALETDYYDVPRGKTLEELAGELEVSHQALSERLRRGHRALIENTLRDTTKSVKQTP